MDDIMRMVEKRRAVKSAEDAGRVADSMEVRMAILTRIKSGEITLEQGQAELRKIQNSANARGKITRAQAFREG